MSKPSVIAELLDLVETLDRGHQQRHGEQKNSAFSDILREQNQQLLNTQTAGELAAIGRARANNTQRDVSRRVNSAFSAAPDSSGPLNSQMLVRRSLQLMQELSPAYLNRFVSHVDTLMWLENAE